jgi:type II secretory pathway component PulF
MTLFSSFGYQDRLFFSKHLATLLKGGIPLAEALRLMAENKEGKIGEMSASVLRSVENGQALSASFKKHPKEFGTFFSSLVEIGEASGTLEKSLDFLAEKISREEGLRKKIKAMLFYPSVVLSVSLVVGGFISFFVLPKLSKIFDAFDVELPLATRMLLWLADFVKNFGVLVVVVLVVFFFSIQFAISFSKGARFWWDRFKFALPFVGRVSRSVSLSSTFRDLGVMVESGLPLEHALRVESEVADNQVIKKMIGSLHGAVSRGETLGKELSKKEYWIFPSLVSRMISVGESSGKLEETFYYLADFFEDETDAAAKNGTAIMEPLLLLIIGLIAGFVALAVILPIYSLTGSINR